MMYIACKDDNLSNRFGLLYIVDLDDMNTEMNFELYWIHDSYDFIGNVFKLSTIDYMNTIPFANKESIDDLTDGRQQTKQMDDQPFTHFVCAHNVFILHKNDCFYSLCF